MELTQDQKIVKSALEGMINKFEGNADLIEPLQTVYTLYISEINAPIVMAAADIIRAEILNKNK